MKDLVTIEHNDKMPLSKPQYKNAPPTQTPTTSIKGISYIVAVMSMVFRPDTCKRKILEVVNAALGTVTMPRLSNHHKNTLEILHNPENIPAC